MGEAKLLLLAFVMLTPMVATETMRLPPEEGLLLVMCILGAFMSGIQTYIAAILSKLDKQILIAQVFLAVLAGIAFGYTGALALVTAEYKPEWLEHLTVYSPLTGLVLSLSGSDITKRLMNGLLLKRLGDLPKGENNE